MKLQTIIIFFCLLALASCKREFAPIQYGEEACSYCKMTIVDKRFAAEIVDKKGKVYKFDDVICMKHFISENKLSDQDVMLFVANYKDQNNFLDPRKAVYLRGDYFRSPMNGNCGAFASADDAKSLEESLGVNLLTWENL